MSALTQGIANDATQERKAGQTTQREAQAAGQGPRASARAWTGFRGCAVAVSTRSIGAAAVAQRQ